MSRKDSIIPKVTPQLRSADLPKEVALPDGRDLPKVTPPNVGYLPKVTPPLRSEDLPKTRYQGSKRKIINTIFTTIKQHYEPAHILDLFGGSAICSLYFQMNNVAVTYNDILKFNSINAHGLLGVDANNIPTEEEIRGILIKQPGIEYDDTFIYDTFKDIYFTDEENQQLDVFRENIQHSPENKRNTMYYLLFQSMMSKRPYNLFHRKNLSMRMSDVERNFGNKTTWDKPFIEHMLAFRVELIKLYENKSKLVLSDTHIINMAYDKMPDELLLSIDTVYIDPPYFNRDKKDSQYFDNYHFLEGFIREDWAKQIDYSTKHLKLITTNDYVIEDANAMFDTMIEKYGQKNLVISYNTTSYPTIADIETKLKNKYNRVITQYIDYNYALSTKKSQEVIILALLS